MKNIFLLLLVTFFLLTVCQNPAGVENNENTYQSHIINQDGIESVLTIDQNTYSLDENISIGFLAVNKSDTSRIHIYTTNGPVYRMSAYDHNNELIQFMPRYRTATIYNFYFEPGGSFINQVSWNQSSFSTNRYSDLKVFSGRCLITFSYVGVNTNGLGKWITISEEGEPLSSKLNWHFSNEDSIKIDFLVRNRISKKLDFLFKQNESAVIQFYEYGNDIPAKEIEFSTNFNKIELFSKSDNNLFTFKESKDNLKNIGLTGSYDCKVIIPCTSRDIIANGFVVIN